MTIFLRSGNADDEQSLLGLFDEAVLWLTDRGLSGQWGNQPWSERPETKERVANLASSSGFTVAEVGDEVVGALEVSEVSPSYAPKTDEPGMYIVLLLASRRFIGQGIGTALLDYARTDCLARGLSLLRVDCWAGGQQQLVRYYNPQASPQPNRSIEGAGLGSFLSSALVSEDSEKCSTRRFAAWQTKVSTIACPQSAARTVSRSACGQRAVPRGVSWNVSTPFGLRYLVMVAGRIVRLRADHLGVRACAEVLNR